MAADGKIKVGIETDLDQATRDIEGFSKRATMSLMSLSQVIQDLPYGFMGIQNNIPILTQQFSSLVKEEKGVFNAFKAIGDSLISPTGLIFAVSAVTAGIDYLIQKYGSLGNAMNVIFAKNQLLTSANLEYKKSLEEGYGKIGGEIGLINVLVERINNLNLSNRDRYAAYVELNKIFPDINANIKNENELNSTSTSIINNLANARLEYIKLKVKENAIDSVLNKTQAEVIKNETNLGLAKRKQIDLENELLSVRKDPISRTRALREAQLKNEIEKQNIVVSQARTELYKVYDVQNSYYKLLDPLIAKIASYDLANKELTNSIKDQSLAEKQAAKDAAKSKKEQADALEKYNKGLEKNRQLGIQFNIKAEDLAIKKAEERQKAEQDLFDTLVQTSMSNDKFGNSSYKIGMDSIKEYTKIIEDMLKTFEKTKNTLNDIFFDPLNELFTNFFAKGEVGFKQFGQAIRLEISKVVAKILASNIISLLANILAPGSGFMIKAGLKGIGTAALGAYDWNLTGPGAANFGGVQGGSMGMSGSVNLTLRGTDLVGAINRTNSQINRVG